MNSQGEEAAIFNFRKPSGSNPAVFRPRSLRRRQGRAVLRAAHFGNYANNLEMQRAVSAESPGRPRLRAGNFPEMFIAAEVEGSPRDRCGGDDRAGEVKFAH